LCRKESRFQPFAENWSAKLPDFVQERLPAFPDAHRDRSIASKILCELGPAARALKPQLMAILEKKCAASSRSYSAVNPKSPEWSALEFVPEVLASIGAGERDVVLILLQNIQHPAIGRGCQLALLNQKEAAIPLVRSEMAACFQNSDPEVRTFAIHFSSSILDTDALLRARVIRAIEEPTPEVRAAAVKAFALHLRGQPELINLVLPRLEDSAELVRVEDCRALGHARWHFETVVPVLAARLGGAEHLVSVRALGDLVPYTRRAFDALTNALASSTEDNWEAIVARLTRLGQMHCAVPALRPLMSAHDFRTRTKVAKMVWELNPDLAFAWQQAHYRTQTNRTTHPEIRKLIQVLERHLNDIEVWAMMEALGILGPESAEAVPVLARLLQNKNERLRSRAAFTLGQIGAPALTALSELHRLRNDDHLYVRETVAKALERIDAAPATPPSIDP
ncbi:MAG: HEAT repeat domain-containing protein, partial [Verrucomicrobiota bacterium]